MPRADFGSGVLDDYGSRQVVFEVKNYEDLKIDDFRQSLSYSGRQYGRLVIIVHRSESEALNQRARGWVKEFWDQHNTLVMTIPSVVLVRCIQKTRSPKNRKRSYVDRNLGKRLDTFERSYVVLRHIRRS